MECKEEEEGRVSNKHQAQHTETPTDCQSHETGQTSGLMLEGLKRINQQDLERTEETSKANSSSLARCWLLFAISIYKAWCGHTH